MLVVADGVGGWANQGIDPGIFSKSLVKNVIQKNQENPSGNIRFIVNKASEEAQRVGPGTSTFVGIRIRPDHVQTLNIGDSGYSIWRYNPADELPIKQGEHLNRLKLLYQSVIG